MLADNFNFKAFSEALAGNESSIYNTSYQMTNSIGALGKYQFMPNTIIWLANKYNLPVKLGNDFLNDPNYQETLFNYYVKDILTYIENNNLNSYFGDQIEGTWDNKNIISNIDVYGLVGGAWIGGERGLNKYLTSNGLYNPSDSNGTQIADYIAYFSSLEIDKKKI